MLLGFTRDFQSEIYGQPLIEVDLDPKVEPVAPYPERDGQFKLEVVRPNEFVELDADIPLEQLEEVLPRELVDEEHETPLLYVVEVRPSEFVLDDELKPFEQDVVVLPSEFVDEEHETPLLYVVEVRPSEFVLDDELKPFEQDDVVLPSEFVDEVQDAAWVTLEVNGRISTVTAAKINRRIFMS